MIVAELIARLKQCDPSSSVTLIFANDNAREKGEYAIASVERTEFLCPSEDVRVVLRPFDFLQITY
jgi:hypothetical protein